LRIVCLIEITLSLSETGNLCLCRNDQSNGVSIYVCVFLTELFYK